MSIEQRKREFQMMINEYNRKEELAKMNSYHASREQKAIQENAKNILGQRGELVNVNKKYSDWMTSVKESLLLECINFIFLKVFDESGIGISDSKYDNLRKGLVSSFVESGNIDSIIYNMKYKSELLSEFALIINETMEKIKSKVNRNDDSTYEIDTTIKDDFFSKLNMLNPDDVVGTIRTRVSDAIEDFVTQNMADKAEITDILQQAKDRIQGAPDDSVKESYNMMAKQKISKIYARPKNILSTMVYNLSESAAINDKIKSQYANEDGSLDIESITETCEVLYAFMETMNTIKLMKFDESNLKKFINIE